MTLYIHFKQSTGNYHSNPWSQTYRCGCMCMCVCVCDCVCHYVCVSLCVCVTMYVCHSVYVSWEELCVMKRVFKIILKILIGLIPQCLSNAQLYMNLHISYIITIVLCASLLSLAQYGHLSRQTPLEMVYANTRLCSGGPQHHLYPSIY